jgi:alpha(1,3/1,4) fucosyltransferase
MQNKILIEFPGHGDDRLFDAAARDAVNEPFLHLRDRLAELGYHLRTADEEPVADCARILFWDFYEEIQPARGLRRLRRTLRSILSPGEAPRRRSLYGDCVRAGVEGRTVLFTGEPPVVLEQNWDPEVHARFPTVLTWNDRLVDGDRFRKFCWPITGRFPTVEPVPFESKKLLVTISANKSSAHDRELYSARQAAIRHFETSRPGGFDLYGVGWADASPPYPSYRGPVRHKWDVFPGYRFGLCYENMRDEPGWITEKLFDCMRADCVPIYWGASNIIDYVDEGTFIDRRRFGSDADLERFLVSVSRDEYEGYRTAIRDYLGGERFAAFLSPAFASTVIRALGLESASLRAGAGSPR